MVENIWGIDSRGRRLRRGLPHERGGERNGDAQTGGLPVLRRGDDNAGRLDVPPHLQIKKI